MASPIFNLPVEVLQRILLFCTPRDVSTFSRSCRATYSIVYQADDQHLWRELYLGHPLDNPYEVVQERRDHKLHARSVDKLNWKERLTEVVKAASLATSSQHPTMPDCTQAIRTFHTLLSELRVACRSKNGSLAECYNSRWLEDTLSGSLLLENPEEEDVSSEVAKQPSDMPLKRSRLRISLCKYFDNPSNVNVEDSPFYERRMTSRCFVYDLRNYTSSTRWGPFYPSGRPDWVHVDHLMTVVWMNVCELSAVNLPLPPRGIEAIRAFSAPGSDPKAEDWAGAEGTVLHLRPTLELSKLAPFPQDLGADSCASWTTGIYSFSDDGPRSSRMFSDPGFREAIRLLEVTLKLITPDEYKAYGRGAPDIPAESETDEHHPVLFFKGGSRGPHGAESIIRGLVFMDTEGFVKWRLFSVYDSTPQWRSVLRSSPRAYF
ncbi:hypothetical protein CC1G_01678 [Coprinopsis cinerea okayama7|uniref:F-box domain-containing protein n=1 Tax=Coprinopsis cinerea (strain Okayama-7 / 130 / ATCC MYA-4618 / FGSC 9003) TaxID=240176 RepID=A8N2H8_COPC7|nr:hypothetical protein CC1G_01678 [Coprinopsis cinerea okayama7\|eukprot:XP_001828998.2 hypothetical protein CC1G_01678 [Coprinopsis cinerea okayama7\